MRAQVLATQQVASIPDSLLLLESPAAGAADEAQDAQGAGSLFAHRCDPQRTGFASDTGREAAQRNAWPVYSPPVLEQLPLHPTNSLSSKSHCLILSKLPAWNLLQGSPFGHYAQPLICPVRGSLCS